MWEAKSIKRRRSNGRSFGRIRREFGVRSVLIDFCDEVLFCQRRFPDAERFQLQQDVSEIKEWELEKVKSETVIHTADSPMHFAKKGSQ